MAAKIVRLRTTLDYFLAHFLKNKVYANAPETIQKVKNNIRTEIVSVDPVLLGRVIKNFKFLAWKKRRGGHIKNIIFFSTLKTGENIDHVKKKSTWDFMGNVWGPQHASQGNRV